MSRNEIKHEDSAPPLKNAIFAVFLHGGYWLIYLLLLLVIFSIAGMQNKRVAPDLPSLAPLIVLCVAPNLVAFYSFYFPLFSRFLSRRKLFLLVTFGALVCLVSSFSGVFFALVFFGSGQAIFADAREFSFLAASLFAIAAIHGAIALVMRGFVVWYGEIKLKEELRQKNFEMESALIRSQTNPHFLFNTLNNIDVLISKDAAKASRYLNKLSDILRYMVYDSKTEKIPLARELEYLEKYLDLQKIRSANPDYVDFETTGEAAGRAIAPMILFPFVENAFKHAENKKTGAAIRIRVSIEKARLIFECENSYHASGKRKSQDFGGLGNELIKQRLQLIYPSAHHLEINDDDGIYRVKLTLYEN